MNHEATWMQRAIEFAQIGAAESEVPIGAVVVLNEKVIGGGYNRRETSHDVTAHAEMIALRDACQRMGDWRLDGAELFVTLEPCLMCFAAAAHARLQRVVYGCTNSKNPPLLRTVYNDWPNAPKIVGLPEGSQQQQECAATLTNFFATLRSEGEIKA